MKDKTCKNCKWYLPPNEAGSKKEKDLAKYAAEQELFPCGFCIRYPPMTKGLYIGSLRAGWAIVQENEYCGEFTENQ